MKKRLSILLMFALLLSSIPALSISAQDSCVAKIGSTEYASLAEAVASAEAGQTVLIVKSGEYVLPGDIPNHIKIAADSESTVNCTTGGNISTVFNGCDFENLVLNLGLSSYHGFQHAGKITMTNCIINGLLYVYGEMEFTNCTFNAPGTSACPGDKEYSVWTYDGDVLFKNCNFNSAGKCINVYNEGNLMHEIRFEGCTFASTQKNKAAINVKEICTEYNRLLRFHVYIDDKCKISSDSTQYFPTSADSKNTLTVLDGLVQIDDRALDLSTVSAEPDAEVVVYWKGKVAYSTYPKDDPEEKEEYVAPVEGEGSIEVKAEIVDNTATLAEISKSDLEKISQPDEKTGKTVDSLIIDLSQSKQDIKAVELSKNTIENLVYITSSKENEITSVKIVLTNASVEIDAKTLQSLSDKAQGNSIKLVVDETKSDELNEQQVDSLNKYDVYQTFEAYFESNGQELHNFNGGNVIVSLKFNPEYGKSAKNYAIYYINENGQLTKYATKYQKGNLLFTTNHFSDYAIIYSEVQDVLLLNAKASGSRTVKLSWNKINNAICYNVYAARCGKKYKKIAKVKSNKYTVKKISKKLKAHATYKFYVVAYDAVGNKIKSKSIHFITGNTFGRYANVKKIKAMHTKINMRVKGKKVLKAKYSMYKGKKHIKNHHGKALRFVSSNPYVASVNDSGKVTAKKAGTAIIYIIDIGGKYCKTKVIVS